MEMTAAEWWSAIGQTALVIVISFIVLCVVTSLVRFQLLTEAATENEELGLGEEKGFRLLVMKHIAAARKAREPISVLLLRIPVGGAQFDEVEAALKAGLRSNDIVKSCGNNLVGLILMCGSEKTGHVIERVMHTERVEKIAETANWHFGVAGYPEHGYKTSEIYSRALAMLEASEKNRVLISGMAEPDAVAEEKAVDKTMVDEATGLVREDKMISTMRRYIAQARRVDKPATLIYLEIDQFDRVTTPLGEAGAGELVKELAQFLDAQFREQDLICRFGTAGFVAGLMVEPAEAMQVTQRVMAAVRKNVFKAGSGTKITMAAGLAGFPDVQGTAVQYFVAAEAALQQAKTRGRNQAVRYESAMSIPAPAVVASDRL